MKEQIGREEAIRLAREEIQPDQAALNSAVLTEYEGQRVWLVGLYMYIAEKKDDAERVGNYVITLNSMTGTTESVRKRTNDDCEFIGYVPQTVYEKVREGILTSSDCIRIAAETIVQAYPELDMLNNTMWETRQDGLTVRFIGRWAGMKSYEVELDENGFVLRCEETDTDSTEEMPENLKPDE